MKPVEAVSALSAVAHEHRLAVYRLLVERGPDGLSAGVIAERVGLPPSSLTFHLQQLQNAGLITQRRLGRQLIYAADFAQMNELVAYLTENCCGGTMSCAPGRLLRPLAKTRKKEIRVVTTPYNVLFLCTGNSARSVMGEVLINHWGKGAFRGFSAGSHPKGTVNPMTLRLLDSLKFSTEGLRSKSWDEFAMQGAPAMDFIFTVCDQAAGETCPFWPGTPMTAHWGVPDPAEAQGSDEQKMEAFRSAWRQLETRIKLFVALPLAQLDRLAAKREMDKIGGIR